MKYFHTKFITEYYFYLVYPTLCYIHFIEYIRSNQECNWYSKNIRFFLKTVIFLSFTLKFP